MASRHRSRQRAAQILYQWDMRKQPVEDAIDNFYTSLLSNEPDEPGEEKPNSPPRDRFMEELVKGTVARVKEIDEQITQNSAHWRLERMPAVDRNILRLAVYEMSQGGTPAAVVIDEALELARVFSGDASVSFINGVLDAVRKQRGPDPQPS